MFGKIAALGVVAAACLGAPTAGAQEAVYDPLEGVNRGLFAVHDAIDGALLEPAARGYRAVTPGPLRTGVRNFLRNIKAPVILANDLLQGEPRRGGTTIARFGVNTTLGLLGLFDPATSMGLERHDEDFGQTLAVWGVAEGPYIFVPALGPTNLRDGAGRIVNMAFDPLNWAEFDGEDGVRVSRGVLTALSAREGVLEEVEGVRQNALDPYVSIRSSYQFLRDSAIENGRSDVQDLPEFEAIPEAMDAPGEQATLATAPGDEQESVLAAADNTEIVAPLTPKEQKRP